MKPNLNKNSKKKSGILTAVDIMKGFTGIQSVTDIWTQQPLQCISLEDKGEDWIKWNANWHENIALRELPKKAKRLQKLYNLAAGIINKSDYQYDPNNEFAEHIGIAGAENESTLLDQFWAIIPNIIALFYGEQRKRDRAIRMEAIDPDSKSERLDYKMGLVKQILEQQALEDAKINLIKAGIQPGDGSENDQFAQEMATKQKLVEAETKYKNYRTIAEQWSQRFVDLFGSTNRFEEDELWAFLDSLIADEAIFAINLREDDFTHERLRPMSTYVNISPNQRYYSKSNFIVNVEFMSLPDIVNTFRNDLTEDQITSIEQQYNSKITGNILFADQIGNSSSYYDVTKSYDFNNSMNTRMKEQISSDTIKTYLESAFRGEPYQNYASNFGDVKLIRVSRIWWPSQRKIGKLTKITEDGQQVIETVDENFKVTVEPEYDKSLLKEESVKTLISGEHVDWKWVVEWRYVVKIGQNLPYYTGSPTNDFENIYLYGEPIKFQFKGDTNVYDAKPPIEGCRFTSLETRSIGLVEKLKPYQIMHNVFNNQAMKLLPKDMGKVLLVPNSQLKKNSLYQEDGLEPVFEFLDSIRDNQVALLDDSKAAAYDSAGRYFEPRMFDLTNIEQISLYLQTADYVKAKAFEAIGVSPQRLSEIGKSESATGVKQAVEGSVNQTEIFFEKFNTDFMPRVWQMLTEAGQYYTVYSESFAQKYLTSELEEKFHSVNKTDLLLKDIHVIAKNTADIRKLMSDIKQLTLNDNTMGATFLDKIKTYTSKSPSKIIEDLEKAEEKRLEQENKKYEEQKAMQEQQQQFLDAQKKADQTFQDDQLNKKLANDRYIAELREDNAAMPTDNSNKEFIEQQKVGLMQETQGQNNENNMRKNVLQEQKQKSDANLEQQKLQVKREEIAANQNIATQNKSNADIKFMQMQRNKNKK